MKTKTIKSLEAEIIRLKAELEIKEKLIQAALRQLGKMLLKHGTATKGKNEN